MCVQWNWISPVLFSFLCFQWRNNSQQMGNGGLEMNTKYEFSSINRQAQLIHDSVCFTTAAAYLIPVFHARPHRPELSNRVRKMSYLVIPLPVGTGALRPPSSLSTGVVAIYFGATLGLALWVGASRAPTRHNLALTSPQSAPSSSHASTSP